MLVKPMEEFLVERRDEVFAHGREPVHFGSLISVFLKGLVSQAALLTFIQP